MSREENRNLANKIALATNHLALDIYGSLLKEQNDFFSPFSIACAFGMLYAGTRANTAKELETILGYGRADLPEGHVPDGFKETMDKLLCHSNNYTLDVANKALVAIHISILESYKHVLTEYYQAELEQANFREDGEAIKNGVNDWVDEKTGGKIDRLLDEPPNQDSMLILLNAVYFKGTWKSKFEEEKTELKPFYNYGTTRKDVQMMHLDVDASFGYIDELNCQILELPYAEGGLSMFLLLPNEVDGLTDLEKEMSLENIQSGINSMYRSSDINVMLPRFKFEKQYNIKQVMQTLGLKEVFEEEAANLSGISTTGRLFVSEAMHKAVVEVNEEGSEAAAVTPMYSMFMCAFSEPMRDQKEFHVDHPFIFIIRENSTGLFLFIGRVSEL